MLKLLRLAGVALLLYPPAAVSQNDPITRVTVNQVRIDAVVTDSKGSFVHDLKSDDFEVFQDGKRQKPVHVQYVAGPEGVAYPQNRELKAADVKRTTVVLFDDAGMSFESFTRARQAVKQYLEQTLQHGDLAAVLGTRHRSSYLNPFMSDPAAVRLAIDQMHYSPPLSRVARRSIFALLQSVLLALGRMPGRKSLIVFSDGMRIPVDSPIDPFTVYRRLADAALRAAVTIYGIDSRGLTTQMLIPVESPVADTGARPPSTQTGSGHQGYAAKERQNDADEARLQQQISDALSPVDANFPPRSTDPRLRGGAFPQTERPPQAGDLDGLSFLANETGGLMLQNNNDVGAQLQKALQDQAGYYLIAWNPGEKSFVPTNGTFADFHNIAVKLTRAGLKARTSHGFYGIASGVQQLGRSSQIAMQEALLSPFQSGQFDAQMTSGFELKDGRGYIRSFVYINGRDIVFTPHPDKRRNDCFAIRLEFLTLPQPIDATLETLAESQITSLEMCGISYEEIAFHGLAVTMLHPVDKPGGYLMRMAVRNVGEGAGQSTPSLPDGVKRFQIREEAEPAVGSAHQLVEVPEWWSAPSLFGLRVEPEKLPDFVVRPRMQGETDRNMTLFFRPAVAEDPAVRRFRPGEKLQYEAHMVNVTDAAAEIRIAHADSNGEVYSGRAESVREGVVSGTYTIDANLASGNYDLQLNITGKDAKGLPYRGVEEIDFEVQAR